MTRPATHIWRLLKWGRTLARYGALRGIERDPHTPAPVQRLVRLARFGTRQPAVPDYAGAFRAIGPAAIKLGQTLATRPDLVGEDAAHNLLALQDDLPPVPFSQIEPDIAATFAQPLDTLFARIDPDPVGAASIAQVHRAVTTDGREVAIKVLRPHIREHFKRDLATYEWAAAHVEAMGGEASRLRPRLVIANFKRWTQRELDLRREAASASELAEAMKGFEGYRIPAIDWDRTNGRVMTIDWIDGIKISRRDDLIAAGHDLPALAERLVIAFLTQAISAGFFHADMHQGNLFVEPDGTIVAIDFGIMGRIDRRARQWLAEILYGLTTGDYRRVAEIHFEAQYVPSYHSVDEFATALRAVGEPMRGKPVKDLSVGQMLDGLFAITRDFDMQTQPHLLLLQKTMVMVEGIATQLDPEINMWDVSAPFVRGWIRDELGPEAALADRLREDAKTLLRLPDLVRRIDAAFPAKGAAPEPPPLADVELIWERRRRKGGLLARWPGYLLAALVGGGAAIGAMALGWVG
ncbi:2-polyprenylphenol 6-hydroxylase [Erythrobacter sp. LQ02-29]|uniref:2-polyprenylphenol 6-hydroxylase n=1 Tax=unclassified Erythrobacter TaxID=2633097 RepID=UPI001BFC021E|nr:MULTISPECIES: 2-polyprenylphenol 6-hydroxylase [unclassified Erythrobacter]MCP9221555.1 2-polyprenylphenol 6-hydroxylase [Erythrobacter sp. LQ02-29]QWC57180.1 2-polyprenylphenol 6-hydroxylase [Erythrobacter sp. 3-20A1M]